MEEAAAGPSPFAWKTLAPKLLEALASNNAEAFCGYWFTHLREAIASASTSKGESAKPLWQADYPLYETYRSVALIGAWWVPAHDPERAAEAAEYLRKAIQTEISEAIDYLVSADEDGVEPTDDDRETAQDLEKLRSGDLFMARVAVRLLGYQPDTSPSPYVAFKDAVWGEVGVLPDQSGRPKRNALGLELRRLFALAQDDAERVRFDGCLANLMDEQRECLHTISTDGYKELERRGWSGQKITETRRAANLVLVDCMPELARFVVPPGQPKN